jgi:hypothetical protein
LRAERQHRQQGRFTDAGPGEQPESLALAAGGEAIERPDTDLDSGTEAAAGGCFGRGGAGGPGGRAAEQDAFVVERVAQRVAPCVREVAA